MLYRNRQHGATTGEVSPAGADYRLHAHKLDRAAFAAGVGRAIPVLVERSATTDEMIMQADEILTRSGIVSKGNTVVITLGAPVALHGSTNLLKIHRIGEADIK